MGYDTLSLCITKGLEFLLDRHRANLKQPEMSFQRKMEFVITYKNIREGFQKMQFRKFVFFLWWSKFILYIIYLRNND